MAEAVGPTRDLNRTKADILHVATEHFMRRGYFGARVDEIAAETATTKRMIYYCFESKDRLFAACLEEAYAGIRAFESEMHLEELPPREAVARYVAGTLQYHEAHPELALLVRTENVLGGVHIAPESPEHLSSASVVGLLDAVLERGRADGSFSSGVTGIDLHVVVSALANFRIVNAVTIEKVFGLALRGTGRLEHDTEQYVDMVLAWLSSREPAGAPAASGALISQPASRRP